MDTSETYIKMCEKAEEIQTKSQPVHIMESRQVFVYDGDEVWFHYTVGEGRDMVINKVWLPRQDQLQEMVGTFPKAFEKLVNEVGINDFNYGLEEMFEWGLFGQYSSLASMEQLWLAFVMKDKFNKVWDGKKWLT